MASILLFGIKEKAGPLAAELRGMGFDLTPVSDFQEGERAMDGRRFSLLLLLGAPESREGEVEVKALADKGKIPVLAILKEGELEGALLWDDFLISPYHPRELQLRLRRLTKEEESRALRRGDLVMDLSRYQVSVAGRPVDLTYKEYELLKFLMERPDAVHTRETLLDKVWGYDYFGGTRTVDVHIRRLRSKLEDRDHTFIETLRNVGYRLK